MSFIGTSSQPKTELSSTDHSEELREYKRRKIINLVGALAIAINSLNSIGTIFENHDPPSITTYSSSGSRLESIVAFSGLGGYGSDLYCTLNAIDPRPVLGMYHNGSFDLNLESQMLIEQAEQQGIKRFAILGDSAGGKMAIKVGANILRESDIGVPEIYLVTTPTSDDDIRPKERVFFEASSIGLKIGGFGARLIGETIVEIVRDYADGWVNSAESVFDRSTKMPSRVLEGQKDLIRQDLDIEDIRTLVENGTRVVYFAPQDPSQDELVNTDWAFVRLKEMIELVLSEPNQKLNPYTVDYYITMVRVGDKHSPLASSEVDLVNGGIWPSSTNATRTNSPHQIRSLNDNPTTDGCEKSYSDVVATLGIGNQ